MVRRCTRPGPMVPCLALAAAIALGLPVVGHSQILYGLVTGTVRDTQGGVLAGVALTASNSGTGLRLETLTDATGNYTFRNMPTGSYDLAASLAGFRSLKQVGLPVTAGKSIRVDLTLELGGLSESVEVRAERSIMQTEKSDLSTELTAKQVMALPLNQYRNYQSLWSLLPGAAPPLIQGAEIDTPGRSLRTWVNGVHPNSNTTRVDGAVSINIWLPHFAGYIQPAETIETVNFSTNAFDADQGMAAGMAQTVVTKSGTNRFGGSGFWFLNRDELDANSYFNNVKKLAKPNLDRNVYGGTLGGPIRKNKLFFFGGHEMFRDRRGRQYSWGVPTEKMRSGDFSEVPAKQPGFALYNPFTGGPGGAGRNQFTNYTIPSGLISPIAKRILEYYPPPNATQDLNSNKLADDYVTSHTVMVDRANYDLKLTFQRSASHSIWGKYSMMDATVVDNFMLGWNDGSLGDTKVYVAGLGHTWTLGPTLVLDGNFGYNRQDQTVTAPDYKKNYGLDLGIPGVNDPNDIRASGMVTLWNGYTLGTESWTPAFRKEITYSFSSALTKAFTGHEIRLGVDVVRMELNHRQAEIGGGLHGRFTFDGRVTGAPGYTPRSWNQFAAFLMGLASSYSKDVQTEDMTGREWQTGLYVRDRWRVNQKLTLNLGLRAEYYPLMTRENSGIERLLYDSYEMILGGRGGQPKDVGIQLKEWYLAPRAGAAYRFTENSVFRAGYGRTINPLPWSRPLRGSFPYDVALNDTAEQFRWVTTLEHGIPTKPLPDYQSGRVKVPPGVVVNSPNPTNVNRAAIQQWNVAFERRLPLGIVADVAYVGTATDGGYAFVNVNHGEPGGGNASRKYYASARTTAVNDWRSCLKSRYHGLQVSFSRLGRNGLMLKGAYTLSRARDMAQGIGGVGQDEDGWTGLAWNHPMMWDANFATAGFDRTHVLNVGFAYDVPFFRDRQGPFRSRRGLLGAFLGGWQVAGVFSAYSGLPFSVPGSNTDLNCPDCGVITADVSGNPQPTGDVGLGKTWYDTTLFSQPTGATKAGFGNSGRNPFRGPPVWNVNMGFSKAFRAGRLRPELRIDVANIFNIVNWGTPVWQSLTDSNFMQFTADKADNGTGSTGTPGGRSVRLGLRVEF